MKNKIKLSSVDFEMDVDFRCDLNMILVTDFVSKYNKKSKELGRPNFNFYQYSKYKRVKELIERIINTGDTAIISSIGRNSKTWIHPILFVDMIFIIDPEYSVDKWLYDELLNYRNDSGASYRKMAGALYDNSTNKNNFHKFITSTANSIKEKIGVKDWNRATEEQLKQRDKAHENIALLASIFRNNDQAVRIGIEKTLEQ